jgi:hypothetical protein
MLDYNKVFLTSQELRILEEISMGKVLRLHFTSTEHLLELGFISKYALSERTDEYVVTAEGLRYVEYKAASKALETKQTQKERREMKATWVSIFVSNLIAFAALIVSIMK